MQEPTVCWVQSKVRVKITPVTSLQRKGYMGQHAMEDRIGSDRMRAESWRRGRGWLAGKEGKSRQMLGRCFMQVGAWHLEELQQGVGGARRERGGDIHGGWRDRQKAHCLEPCEHVNYSDTHSAYITSTAEWESDWRKTIKQGKRIKVLAIEQCHGPLILPQVL